MPVFTVYIVKNPEGCVSSATQQQLRRGTGTNSPPLVRLTQPTCDVATGTIEVTSPVGAGYTYSTDGTNYQSGITFSGISTGSYTVTVKNADGCVSSATSATIEEQPLTPDAPVVGTITQPTCEAATGSVILSGLPTGNWTINPGNITGSATSTTINNLTEGTYNYTVTNELDCTSPGSADIIINEQPVTPPVPTITASGSITFCEGENVTLTSGEAAAYLWSNGATTQSITVSTSGNYTVTITNAEGCEATSEATGVKVLKPVQVGVSIAATATSVCPGISVTFTATPVNGGAPSYQWYNGTTPVGTDESTYTYTPEDGEVVTVEMTSTESCISGSPATSNAITMIVDESPAEPETECYETATWNQATCSWEVTGTQPEKPAQENCWDEFIFNSTTCQWENTGIEPLVPAVENCWDDYRFNTNTCEWENIGTQPGEPVVECYQIATWNETSCSWDVTGTQPEAPSTECWETATWNETTCSWDVSGSRPEMPIPVNCWDEFVFDNTACQWENTGKEPIEPAPVNCWDVFIFNNNTCEWENIGNQPEEPVVECYQMTNWNERGCNWDITGTQPKNHLWNVGKPPPGLKKHAAGM